MASGQSPRSNAILRLHRVSEATAREGLEAARARVTEVERQAKEAQELAARAARASRRAEEDRTALIARRPKVAELQRADAHLKRCLREAEQAKLAERRAVQLLARAQADAEEARSAVEIALRKRQSIEQMTKREGEKEARSKVRRAQHDPDDHAPWRSKRS